MTGTCSQPRVRRMVRVSAGTKRKVWTGDDSLRLLIVGGVPGKAYEPPENTELGGPDPFSEQLRQAQT